MEIGIQSRQELPVKYLDSNSKSDKFKSNNQNKSSVKQNAFIVTLQADVKTSVTYKVQPLSNKEFAVRNPQQLSEAHPICQSGN